MSYGSFRDNFNTSLDTITRGQTTEQMADYLGSQSLRHQERLLQAWEMMTARATPSFNANDQAPFGVPIPISYQETNYVEHSLNLYRSQLNRRAPFRAVGYLNWPDGAPRREIAATRMILDRFIDHNPDVPFTYFEGPETGRIAIGGIRKLVSEALLPFIHRKALFAGHDADMVDLSPNHFPTLYNSYYDRAAKQPASVIPVVRHRHISDLPNIDSLITWLEDPELNELADVYYEPGPAVAADDYMEAGGYGPALNIAETHQLIENISQLSWPPREEARLAPSAVLTLSPRRLVAKFSSYDSIDELWTPDNFLAEDSYRTADDSTISQHTDDIPDTIRDVRLREFGSRMRGYVIRQMQRTEVAQPVAKAEQRLEIIRQRLGGPADMFTSQ